jgi:D-aspartate ligase
LHTLLPKSVLKNEVEGPSEMEDSRNPVVVLGGDLTALGMARTFGKRGIDVYLILDKDGIAAFSKYCKRSFLAPKIRDDRTVLRNVLKKIAKSLSRRPVVYPTSDLGALNLAHVKDELPDDYHFVVGDKEPVETLVNKRKFYKALDRNGIDYPVTVFPEDFDFRKAGTKTTYPIFVRPSNSQLFKRIFGAGGRKGFIANSPRELAHYYRLAERSGIDVMFQEIIPGPPSNSYQLEGYYNVDFCPIVLFARKRLRIWPQDFGNTTLCTSIPLTELSKEKAVINNFVKKISYHGLMSAEFKKDARDGILKFLEINARGWWHFWLSAKCGADIVYSSYLDAVGEKTKYIDDYETGLKSMYLLTDLRVLTRMFLNRNLDLRNWISSIQEVDQFATFEREDISPFIMDYANKVFLLLERQLQRFKRNIVKAAKCKGSVSEKCF